MTIAEARKAILLSQRSALAGKIEELQETMKYLDNKINHYEDKVLPKEKELREKE